jgi:hypothetical protein
MAQAKPNLFIVGAPRCGTTALHGYLGRHEQVFWPAIKEPHWFSSDLNAEREAHRGSNELRWPINTLEQYLWLFRGATGQRWRGDASVLYLYSAAAAGEIAAFNPAARIIVMLREPVAFLQSFHAALVYLGDEDCWSLPAAIELEAERAAGRRVPASVRTPSTLRYTKVASFSEQLARYTAAFPKDQVKVIVFDDFAADPAGVYREVLEFLELRESAAAPAAFRQVNPNRAPRWRRVSLWARAIDPHVLRLWRDPTFPRAPGYRPPLLARLLPLRAGLALHRAVERVNSRRVPRTALPDDARAALQRRMRGEVERLSAMLGRDLIALWGYERV